MESMALIRNVMAVSLDFLSQIGGGRGGIHHNVVQFVLAGIFWSVMLVFAWERRQEKDSPREQFLAVGFALGLGRELFMLCMAFILALGLIDHSLLHVVFPPVDHVLTNGAIFFVAGAFIFFFRDQPGLSRRFIFWSIGSLVGCYLVTFWGWAQFVLDNPHSKFGQTWYDWLFHINSSIWLLVSLVLIVRGQKGRLTYLVGMALALFLMAEFLKLPDMALDEVYEPIFAPIRHCSYLLAIFLLGFVYIREQSAERKRVKQQVMHLAHHDLLTGLPNRTLFRQRLECALEHAKVAQSKLALLFLDLDQFKRVNDTFGHHCGDRLIQAVARRLDAVVGECGTVARMGGDEFTVLLPTVRTPEEGGRVAEKILDALKEPFTCGHKSALVTTSIGIVLFPDDGVSAEDLCKHADMAMYAAKGAGGGRYHLFSEEIRLRAATRHLFEESLTIALDEAQFHLLYEPQVDVVTGRVTGAEALVRWRHPEIGMMRPSEFICIAEETGHIVRLGEWVLRDACRQLREWQDQGYPLHVSVNVSAVQFSHPQFISMVDAIIKETAVNPALLVLEVTESVLMSSSSAEILDKLKRRGISIAIDDFGTGYSSLSYLKHFPVDRIKVDKSFVSGIPNNTSDTVIVRTILAMAHTLGLAVLAEGVETEEQLRYLRKLKCEQIQGHLIGRPMQCDEFIRLFGKSTDGRQERQEQRHPAAIPNASHFRPAPSS